MSEIYTDIQVLLKLSDGTIGLRKVHKDITIPRVIGRLHELMAIKRSKQVNGCEICNDTSNDRYYRFVKQYKYCPHCGTSLDYLNETVEDK